MKTLTPNLRFLLSILFILVSHFAFSTPNSIVHTESDDCSMSKTHVGDCWTTKVVSVTPANGKFDIQILVTYTGQGGGRNGCKALSHYSIEAADNAFSNVSWAPVTGNPSGNIELSLGNNDPFDGFKLDNVSGIGDADQGSFTINYTLDYLQDQQFLAKAGNDYTQIASFSKNEFTTLANSNCGSNNSNDDCSDYLTMYALDDNNPGNLYFIKLGEDPVTVHTEGDIQGLQDSEDMESLAIDANGDLFFINVKRSSKLYKIPKSELDQNENTPVNAQFIGNTGITGSNNKITNLTFINGELYGIGVRSEKVYKISTTDGSVTQVATLNRSFYTSGLTVAGDGTVYLIYTKNNGDESELWKFNSFPSGDIEKVLTIENSKKVESLAAHPNGFLYAADDFNFFKLDPVNKTTEVAIAYKSDIEGLAFFYEKEENCFNANNSDPCTDGATVGTPTANDPDGDGINNECDLDDDNDGILDTEECEVLINETSFEVRNGNSVNFTLDAVGTGFILDITKMDNSFNLTINGTPLTTEEIQFQQNGTPTGQNIRFKDGSLWGKNGIPQIYQFGNNINPETPIVRFVIDENLNVTMYGSKTANGELEELELFNGNSFNSFTWNSNATNNFVVSQVVTGPTYINGRVYGTYVNCDTDGDGITNNIDLDSDNDGCYDVVESGGVDANNDGILDGTGFDNTGKVTGGTNGYNGANGNEYNAHQLTITTSPTDKIVSPDQSATFTVVATAESATEYNNGNPEYNTAGNANAGIQYHWYLGDPNNGGTALTNSGIYSGVDSATLQISLSEGLSGNEYYVKVSHTNNPCLEEISSATLTAVWSSIGDRVWFDSDGDTNQDPDEPGLEGATVTLDPNTPNDPSDDQTTTTDANGAYIFENLSAGTYIITVDVSTVTGGIPNGKTASDLIQNYDANGLDTPNESTVTLAIGEDNLNQDFGYLTSSDETSGGNGGGVESESLGDALTKIYVGRKKNSVPTEFVKNDENKYDKKKLQKMQPKSKGQTMLDMFPTELVSGDVAHVTSPTDILDYTIADEVLSVDFSLNGQTKGVVLGIKTSDRVYNHTKASCDRLRGAEILNVQQIHVNGYNFLMQALLQRNGEVEYAISFAIGKNNNDTNYDVQTNWYVNHYNKFNDMYNFQVWSTQPAYT
ncbi:MAG: hypothetical protein CMB99_01535, partial [Flavobacteriaceae bacterium]|nr:hypothetical protein [Flavobacteriaceae bacterium]